MQTNKLTLTVIIGGVMLCGNIRDLKPNAEVPCVTKDQRGMVRQYDKIDPTPVTDKIDSTQISDNIFFD